MKYPKIITINGNKWKLKQSRHISGGRFDYVSMTIEIDKNSKTKDSILLHEIIEIIMCEHRLRFDGTSDNSFRFFLNHDDFTRLCDAILAVIKDNKLF